MDLAVIKIIWGVNLSWGCTRINQNETHSSEERRFIYLPAKIFAYGVATEKKRSKKAAL